MPKTLPRGLANTAVGIFALATAPDVFDLRDLEYRPGMESLPPVLDSRGEGRFVLTQEGASGTGYAVAAMINTVLASGPDPVRASPAMFSHMAQRYDEFGGTPNAGSSLRSALKGWLHHGVLSDRDWPDRGHDPYLDINPALGAKAMEHPLSAFYRVNALRVDDLKLAVNERGAIVVSAQVHSGWLEPLHTACADGSNMYLIQRTPETAALGDHAFAIVGYNEGGFLVQNSWGPRWGDNGFATLPYEDWLASAHDAWVAKPGTRSSTGPHGAGQGPATTSTVAGRRQEPDVARLQAHVVNLGHRGRLSTTGRFISTPAQIEHIFARMQGTHDGWAAEAAVAGVPPSPPRVVFYAHGGMVSERGGLAVAQAQLQWWMANHVYPVFFAWESGPIETLVDQLADMVRERQPPGGVRIGMVEQSDRLVEGLAREHLGWAWSHMKQDAAAASLPLPGPVSWPPTGKAAAAMAAMPGAALVADRLRGYLEVPGRQNVEVHLAGHSAGAIFGAHFLTRLLAQETPVASMSWLAPAIRVDDFARLVLPALERRAVGKFVSFGLSDPWELDDTVGVGFFTLYHKSLLYLISRGLEEPTCAGERHVPLLGMQRYLAAPLGSSTLGQTLSKLGAEMVFSPTEAPVPNRTCARTHHGFDEDIPTMTSVMLRILDRRTPTERTIFRPDAPEG